MTAAHRLHPRLSFWQRKALLLHTYSRSRAVSHQESRAAPRSSQPPLHPGQEPLPAKRNHKKQAFGYRGCCPGCVRARSQPQDAGPGDRGICSLLNRWLLQRGQARTGDYCWALTSSRKGKANFHPQQQKHAACGGATASVPWSNQSRGQHRENRAACLPSTQGHAVLASGRAGLKTRRKVKLPSCCSSTCKGNGGRCF